MVALCDLYYDDICHIAESFFFNIRFPGCWLIIETNNNKCCYILQKKAT